MEIKASIEHINKGLRFCFCVCALLCFIEKSAGQNPLAKYMVQDGKMLVVIDKHIKTPELDSFIFRFDLSDLSLKEFIHANFSDSIVKKGWKIETNSKVGFMISKSLDAFNNITNPGDKIIFLSTHPDALFPSVNNGVSFGSNRFRNKFPFEISKGDVLFFLRGNANAPNVKLAGSFNNWSDKFPMIKTDSGWIARVKLSPGKYWYKFIVDGNWIVDDDNLLKENDGEGNDNSVFFRTNYIFTLTGFSNAKKVILTGSFNNWNERQLLMNKTATGWSLPIYLAEGTHTYKFIVDGEWHSDEKNVERLPDGHGNYNSVVRLGKAHLFKLNGFENAKKVMLSGSFNNWKEDELLMNKTSSGWELPYTLGPGDYEYKFIADGKWIRDPSNQISQKNKDDNFFVIIEPNYTFRLKGFEHAKTVFLSGDFNNWNEGAFSMVKEGDEWIFRVHLFAGKHLYKFLVDGKWFIDPENKLWEQNEFGTGNSIIWIEK